MINRETLKAIGPIRTLYRAFICFVHRLKLAAAALRDWKDRQSPDYVPIPPAKLRFRVHGSMDKESFLKIGETSQITFVN